MIRRAAPAELGPLAEHGFVEAERTDGAANQERTPDARMVWTP